MSNVPGLNLADLAPMHTDVPYGESFIRVHGVSAKTALAIFARFPKIAGMVSGDKFNLSAFLTTAPDAVAAIIAAAAHTADDELAAAEANAAGLPVEIQLDLMEAIGGMTFVKGFGPFVERVIALANKASSGISGKVSDTKWPQVSKPSSQPDIPPQ